MGSSEGKAGEEGKEGHRKLQDYSCKGRGTGSGEETHHSLKDQGCGVPQFQEYLPQGCQILNGHLLRLREAFT